MLLAKLTVQVQLIMTSMNYDHYDQFDLHFKQTIGTGTRRDALKTMRPADPGFGKTPEPEAPKIDAKDPRLSNFPLCEAP
jgi:hypothetical protein